MAIQAPLKVRLCNAEARCSRLSDSDHCAVTAHDAGTACMSCAMGTRQPANLTGQHALDILSN